MPIELSPIQQAVLKETAPAPDPAAFQALLEAAQPEMDRIVREIMEPSQSVDTTVTELRDLYLAVTEHQAPLAAVSYGPERRALFRDGIRLAATADLWFSEGKRTGAFRARSVEETIQASRPWRARLKAWGDQAFVFEPDIADQLGDVNSTGTLDEERTDLQTLIALVEQHEEALKVVGMPASFVLEGKALLAEASGRDLLGILGMRNQEEAALLRNRIVTYATLLGREARAAGVNAFFGDAEIRRRFEAASFRNALRRLRPRRRGAIEGEAPLAAPPAEPKGGTP